jgi:hypothetical protein
MALTDHRVRQKRINLRKKFFDAHGPGLMHALTRDTCCFFRPNISLSLTARPKKAKCPSRTLAPIYLMKFSKCLNQTSLICIFKTFGVILLHFKVEKLNQGVILQKKIFEGEVGRSGYRNHTYFFIWPFFIWPLAANSSNPGCHRATSNCKVGGKVGILNQPVSSHRWFSISSWRDSCIVYKVRHVNIT